MADASNRVHTHKIRRKKMENLEILPIILIRIRKVVEFVVWIIYLFFLFGLPASRRVSVLVRDVVLPFCLLFSDFSIFIFISMLLLCFTQFTIRRISNGFARPSEADIPSNQRKNTSKSTAPIYFVYFF